MLTGMSQCFCPFLADKPLVRKAFNQVCIDFPDDGNFLLASLFPHTLMICLLQLTIDSIILLYPDIHDIDLPDLMAANKKHLLPQRNRCFLSLSTYLLNIFFSACLFTSRFS